MAEETLSICNTYEEAVETLQCFNEYLMLDCWIAPRTFMDWMRRQYRIVCLKKHMDELGQVGRTSRRAFSRVD